MDNKRKYQRSDAVTFVSYKPGLFSGEVNTLTENISLKGACFFSDRKLEEGKIITLKLQQQTKEGLKKIKARIIYSKPIKDKTGSGFFNGVEFID